jgi:hypothetical protein
MDRLLAMLSRAYVLALEVQDPTDNRDEQALQALAEEVSGECAEFLALFNEDMGSFGDEESIDKELVALVEKLKGV